MGEKEKNLCNEIFNMTNEILNEIYPLYCITNISKQKIN